MSKSRKKRKTPKRVLALPDLEQAKSAVLNTLTSKSSQRTYDHARNSLNGTVRNRDWHSIEPSCCGIGLALSRNSTRRRRLTCD